MMSHTDKDRPYWVRCNDELEPTYIWHTCCHPWRGHRECMIGPAFRPGDPRNDEYTCGPMLDVQHWSSSSAPRWFNNACWTVPERARETRVLRDAVKLANGDGIDDDFDYPNYQHRHGGSWLYW